MYMNLFNVDDSVLKYGPWVSYETHFLSFPRKIVSQFVIPAKSLGAGCEPGSRMIGFPFDFAQGGEPVEPRVSPNPVSSTGQACGLARNDSLAEMRYSLFRGYDISLDKHWKHNFSVD
jgi:hypothetical protein